MTFDPYHKWLGIPPDKRPITYYDLLGLQFGEKDPFAIRSAIEQRRSFVSQQRGQGQDHFVQQLLSQIETATTTLLSDELKFKYDKEIAYLKPDVSKSKRRRSYMLPRVVETRIERIYGEGSGIVGDLFGIVAIIFSAFALMAILSFTLQKQATKSDEPRELTWMEKAAEVASTELTNPVKEAKEQIARIEATLAKLEEVVKSAKTERSGLAVKLKGMGINSASDVKGNPLAKRTAEDIGRLSNEIESQEKKAVALASKLQQAKTILRRMELEQFGISEDELNKLALQLHESDKTEDGWSQPINPIDIDQAVDKALAASGPNVAKITTESSRQETNGVDTPGQFKTTAEINATDTERNGVPFDGKSFAGWRFVAALSGQNQPSLQDAWGIQSERGVLFARGVGSTWLATERKMGDFNLQFDWRFPPNGKISPNGSGVVIRANGINETGYDPRGIEIDLSDGERLGAFLCYDAGMSSTKGVAKDRGVGLLEPISKPVRKPVGQWNTTIIESHGRELTVYINGQKVNQGKTDLSSTGEICLRSQNTAVEFRDLRFTSNRRSDESETASQASDSLDGTAESIVDSSVKQRLNSVGISGSYQVQWKDESGNAGEMEYRFLDDSSVVRAGKPVGKLSRRDEQIWLDFDETKRGSVLLMDIKKGTFKGLHTWEDGRKATWIARRNGSDLSLPEVSFDPFKQNSVWTDERLKLTVTDRQGETFRARFESANWARNVKGTIIDGRVSWLAKDVQPIKLGKGGDNEGNIVSDQNGYKLNMEWKQSDGTSGKFTLRLDQQTPSIVPLKVSENESSQSTLDMFDGKTLNGWRAGGAPDAWRVEDGAIICNGKPSHLYYVGSGVFKNFHFRCEAKCFSGSNSGVYFHTRFKDQGFPSAGFECQIDNHTEKRKTGSLYGLVDVTKAWAKDGKWFTLEIIVKDKLITIKIDGKVVVNYKEPNNQKPNPEFERLIGEGIFALQSNSPGFETHFRNLQIRRFED